VAGSYSDGAVSDVEVDLLLRSVRKTTRADLYLAVVLRHAMQLDLYVISRYCRYL
jgi:hypothetical protein